MRKPFILVSAVAVLAIALVSAGCSSDDDPLSLDEYFAEVASAAEEFNNRQDEIGAETDQGLEDAGDDFDEGLDVFRDGFSDQESALDDFVGELDGLSAPDEVETLHADAVTAGEAAVEAFADVNDGLGDVDSEEEFTAFADVEIFPEDAAVNVAVAEFQATCVALQDYADDNGISVDLMCSSGAS